MIIDKMHTGSIPVFDAGLVSYSKTFEYQKELAGEISEKSLRGVILLLEHYPVITTGSNRSTDNLLTPANKLHRSGIGLVNSNRGGDITLHAPGQIICYPVFNLESFGKDIGLFVFDLEEVLIDTLNHFGIKGIRIEGHRGVFAGNGKIASIGLRVRKWISIHGFSLNVNIDLSYFQHIIACGLKDFPQVSMASLLKKHIAIDDVKEQIINSFKKVFAISIQRIYAK